MHGENDISLAAIGLIATERRKTTYKNSNFRRRVVPWLHVK